jgi:hypothetical protein
MHPRLRMAAWIACVFALIIGTLTWLFALRGARILNSDPILIGGWLILGGLIFVIAILLKTTPPDAIKLSPRSSASIILSATVALHAAALVLLIPGLSEDVIRYRLDGRMWLSGVSPYAVSPGEFLSRNSGDAADRLVTFPQLHTIYPPVSQLVFAAARAAERLTPSPGNPGEGRGEGSVAIASNSPSRQNPHPNPLPEYRERGFSEQAYSPKDLASLVGTRSFAEYRSG